MKSVKTRAWAAFARYIRAKYADKDGYCTCVTCGKRYHYKDGRHINAGHFVPSRCNSILFDEDVVRPQCAYCNCGGGGEQYKFAEYYKNVEGKTEEQIEEMLSRKHKIVKYKDSDFRDIEKRFNELAEHLIFQKEI
jgi:hypothetical protein